MHQILYFQLSRGMGRKYTLLTVWPDLEQLWQNLSLFLRVYLVFTIILNLLRQFYHLATFHSFKWPNLEQIVQTSGPTSCWSPTFTKYLYDSHKTQSLIQTVIFLCFFVSSVTRLGDFWKFLATKFVAKVAQTIGNILGNVEKPYSHVKNCCCYFLGNLWKHLWLLFLQHLVTLFISPHILERFKAKFKLKADLDKFFGH